MNPTEQQEHRAAQLHYPATKNLPRHCAICRVIRRELKNRARAEVNHRATWHPRARHVAELAAAAAWRRCAEFYRIEKKECRRTARAFVASAAVIRRTYFDMNEYKTLPA